jgi:hypothetical protein
LEKQRSELDSAEAALELTLKAIRERSKREIERERDLAGERSEAELQRFRFEAESDRLETERIVWREQREHFERQLAQMQAEVERVARLLIDDGQEVVSSAA